MDGRRTWTDNETHVSVYRASSQRPLLGWNIQLGFVLLWRSFRFANATKCGGLRNVVSLLTEALWALTEKWVSSSLTEELSPSKGEWVSSTVRRVPSRGSQASSRGSQVSSKGKQVSKGRQASLTKALSMAFAELSKEASTFVLGAFSGMIWGEACDL